MSVMFSGDALQCCNFEFRINREWAKRYCNSQGESIGLDTFRQGQVVGRRLSILSCPFPTCDVFQEKLESCPTLFAPQRHNDLLVTTGKNNAPILNGLEL